MSTETSTSDSVVLTTIGTTSTSFTTSFSTTVTVTGSATDITSETSSLPPTTITSVTSLPTSTTVVPPSSTPTSPSVVEVTATITQTPSTTPGALTTPTPSLVVVTSTFSQDTASNTATDATTLTSSTASSTASALSASGSGSGSSGGLKSGAKIAIAVIVPIVVIAALFLIGFFLWRKRKARKNAEELRKSEMAEYGFNPNSDPTLVAAAGYTENQSEGQDDTSGYRGWGATSSNRKASTTLGSNGRAAGGPAMSESSSQPGGYAAQTSPNTVSDHYSEAPLMKGHPESGDSVAELGAAAGAGALHRHRSGNGNGNGNGDIRRGPSNASSAYSAGNHSDTSSEAPQMPGPFYQEEVPYNIYNENSNHGPYGDGSYGGAGGQPVIRDNQARRNTRIERAPTFPHAQGGIAQNF